MRLKFDANQDFQLQAVDAAADRVAVAFKGTNAITVAMTTEELTVVLCTLTYGRTFIAPDILAAIGESEE